MGKKVVIDFVDFSKNGFHKSAVKDYCVINDIENGFDFSLSEGSILSNLRTDDDIDIIIEGKYSLPNANVYLPIFGCVCPEENNSPYRLSLSLYSSKILDNNIKDNTIGYTLGTSWRFRSGSNIKVFKYEGSDGIYNSNRSIQESSFKLKLNPANKTFKFTSYNEYNKEITQDDFVKRNSETHEYALSEFPAGNHSRIIKMKLFTAPEGISSNLLKICKIYIKDKKGILVDLIPIIDYNGIHKLYDTITKNYYQPSKGTIQCI